jgi:hypothetical protein
VAASSDMAAIEICDRAEYLVSAKPSRPTIRSQALNDAVRAASLPTASRAIVTKAPRPLALSSIDTGDKHPGSATFRIVDASACELLPPELPPGLLETLLNRSLGDEGFIG